MLGSFKIPQQQDCELIEKVVMKGMKTLLHVLFPYVVFVMSSTKLTMWYAAIHKPAVKLQISQ